MAVVMGRETSTVRGAWDVRVSACWPRSNYVTLSAVIITRLDSTAHKGK